MKRFLNRGFALLDLLILLAAIGVLSSLLIVGVGYQTEQARQNACVNNLKQLALAVHNYHDVFQSMPAARGAFAELDRTAESDDPGSYFSAFVVLTPFTENAAVYGELRRYTEKNREKRMTSPYVDTDDFPAMKANIPTFQCPSDTVALKPSLDGRGVRRISYATSRGDSLRDNSRKSDVVDEEFAKTADRGAFLTGNKFATFARITDGLSNTVMFSEILSASSYADRDVQGSVVGNLAKMATESGSIPKPCLDLQGDDGKLTRGASEIARGQNWLDGAVMTGGFTTVLPPNAPSCSFAGADSWGVASAQSRHPDGVNVALMDGSVRFCRNDIDCGDPSASPVVKGPSPFGVWGAFGSAQGGEMTSRSL